MTWAYDPLQPSFDLHLHDAYKQLRTEQPVYFWEQAQTWLITRHADVMSVLRDRRFSSNQADWRHARPLPQELLDTPFMQLQRGSFLAGTDADHARLRRLVSPAFTPRAVEKQRSGV